LIILDTNILSEPYKVRPNENVLAWLLEYQSQLYTTAVTVAELFYGACRLPAGKRREGLLLAVEELARAYDQRVLSFDADAARVYGLLQANSRQEGSTLSVEDAMIAAICRVHKATLATHNTKDFANLDVPLTDPFIAPAPNVVTISLSS
jgi:predicted nucleic acid-binding protein